MQIMFFKDIWNQTFFFTKFWIQIYFFTEYWIQIFFLEKNPMPLPPGIKWSVPYFNSRNASLVKALVDMLWWKLNYNYSGETYIKCSGESCTLILLLEILTSLSVVKAFFNCSGESRKWELNFNCSVQCLISISLVKALL